MSQLAFLGLGTMGAAMAANLAKAGQNATNGQDAQGLGYGFTVEAWNRTPNTNGANIAAAGGARVVNTIAEAVADAAVIFTCVSKGDDVMEVVQQVALSVPDGALIVDFSTIGATAAQTIAAYLAAQGRGLRFMDAPVSGGDIGARAGTLTIMVGGSEADFAAVYPYLMAMGKSAIHCGAVGCGQAVKLCNQVLCAVTLAGVCEALEFARVQGVNPQLVVDVCQGGAAGSWQLSNLGPKIIAADFAPGFALKHMTKDLNIAQEVLGNKLDDLPAFKLVAQLFALAKELDHGAAQEQGTQAVIRAYGL
ncbi:MAG: NAD(P)-dependent oxidoreductase [Pseudanabaena sp. ELA607]|jgi:3-hydroxyisobutyrate dehydrogenase